MNVATGKGDIDTDMRRIVNRPNGQALLRNGLLGKTCIIYLQLNINKKLYAKLINTYWCHTRQKVKTMTGSCPAGCPQAAKYFRRC